MNNFKEIAKIFNEAFKDFDWSKIHELNDSHKLLENIYKSNNRAKKNRKKRKNHTNLPK